jgi:hypothetical protein
MKICDMASGTIRIQRATRRLQESWRETQEHWNDTNSRQFEKQYLVSLLGTVGLTVNSIRRMAKVLEQAERECEDEV